MITVLVLAWVLLGMNFLASACGGSGSAPTSSTLDVVAAENVYGNIAQQIGGSHVSVTSILSDPNADPHLFEPGTANGLAVAGARVVIQNGLGYDAFMTKLENAAPSSTRTVLTVADALGVHGKDANPHLWYDVPQLPRIAGAIAGALEHADPRHAAAYRAALRGFDRSLAPLQREVAGIRARFGGAPVAYTERVPGYLVAAAGLRDLAPATFTRPIEEGSEPPPAAVAAMDALVAQHRIRVLLYNNQAVSPITARIRAAALNAGIPVVPVSEMLPPHLTFQQWQLRQARALTTALEKT
jgi:zinc/manganese transport system substrate-binding protein